jgi:hypothetical protein
MKTAVAIAPEEDFYVVSNPPPSRTQKRLALAIVLFTFAISRSLGKEAATGRSRKMKIPPRCRRFIGPKVFAKSPKAGK